MRSDLTDITIVLDRSGSMNIIRAEAEGGLNNFIEKQKELPGEALLTLVQFDDRYDVVHKAVPVKEIKHCSIQPRGNTALLDAVGKAIVQTGERLSAIPEEQRPGLVVFVILTDGMENASNEYTSERIQEMVKEQQDTYKWQFTYLGANQDAFAVAKGMGMPLMAAANYSGPKAKSAFGAAASNVGRMRGQVAAGAVPTSGYTDTEREEMK